MMLNNRATHCIDCDLLHTQCMYEYALCIFCSNYVLEVHLGPFKNNSCEQL